MDYQTIDIKKIKAVMRLIYSSCQGPKEAFAVLCSCLIDLHEYNNEDNRNQGLPLASIDDLIADISTTIRSHRIVEIPDGSLLN